VDRHRDWFGSRKWRRDLARSSTWIAVVVMVPEPGVRTALGSGIDRCGGAAAGVAFFGRVVLELVVEADIVHLFQGVVLVE
jgi:hypothetical protein